MIVFRNTLVAQAGTLVPPLTVPLHSTGRTPLAPVVTVSIVETTALLTMSAMVTSGMHGNPAKARESILPPRATLHLPVSRTILALRIAHIDNMLVHFSGPFISELASELHTLNFIGYFLFFVLTFVLMNV